MPGPLSADAIKPYADPAYLSRSEQAATPAPRSHTPIHALLAAMNGAAAADVITTHQALESGRGTEANPLAGSHPSLGKLIGMKSAAMVPSTVILDKMYEHHPKLSLITTGLLTALQAGIAAHNHKVGR